MSTVKYLKYYISCFLRVSNMIRQVSKILTEWSKPLLHRKSEELNFPNLPRYSEPSIVYQVYLFWSFGPTWRSLIFEGRGGVPYGPVLKFAI